MFSDRFSDRTNWTLEQNRFTAALEEARARGARILDLTVSNPTQTGLHYNDAAILGALSSPHALDYDPQPQGLLPAREAVAEYYRSEHGVRDMKAKQIVLTTSTSEAYSFVVLKPSYPLFEFLADLQDVKLVPYPLIYDHGWQIDFPSLEKAATWRTRGVVVVHPNNPTGSYVQAGELELLNAFCSQHKLAVIVDEVFLDYSLNNDAHASTAVPGRSERSSTVLSAASFVGNSDVLTFTLSGLSKISALPQMKVAWIVTSGPPELAAAAMGRLEVIADTYLSMNAPMQWALPMLLEQRKNIQQQLLERVKGNLAALDRQLAGQKNCVRLRIDGGWYAILEVPRTMDEDGWVDLLVREEGVIVHPGYFFDLDREGYLVVSLILQTEKFGPAIERVIARVGT